MAVASTPGGTSSRPSSAASGRPRWPRRPRASAPSRGGGGGNLKGWPKISKLAQDFDCKSLLTASSWPNFWANPVTFILGHIMSLGTAFNLNARKDTYGRSCFPARLDEYWQVMTWWPPAISAVRGSWAAESRIEPALALGLDFLPAWTRAQPSFVTTVCPSCRDSPCKRE
jgi:hypothetical protein